MIKMLIIFAIVAGLVFESHQQNPEEKKKVVVKPPPRPLPVPCYYPTNTKCWTEWFDSDDPCENGDFELIANLRRKYPGKMCSDPAGVEVETVSGLTVVQTGDFIRRLDTKVGFICRNKDQFGKKCSDYRIRFSCYAPFCDYKVCWTPFFDRDNPSGTGDWELLSDLRKENPGKICEKPMFIEAVTSDGLVAAYKTREKPFIYNPTQGFVCRNKDQKDGSCLDYKVRFGCPCKHEIHEWK